jgi:hypothetical protein
VLAVVLGCGSSPDPHSGATVGGNGSGGASAGGAGPALGGSGGAFGKGGSGGGTAAPGAPSAGTGDSNAAGGAATDGLATPGGTAGVASGGGAAGTGVTNSAGVTGAGTAGASSAGGAGSGNSFVSDVAITVHPNVNTLLVVKWTQAVASDQVWLEFSFESGVVMRSRGAAGTIGAHEDVVIGTPGATEVTVRIVNQQGTTEHKTEDYKGTTKALPSGFPLPEVVSYDAALASPDRWMFGAVEDSDGGCANQSCYYHTTFWVYIMDRKGRIVWYYADPASNATSSFQRIARDGEYIWIEKRPFGAGGTREVVKMTLDRKFLQRVPVANLSDCIDVTTDGSLLYDVTTGSNPGLKEMTKDGTVRHIWSCRTHFGQRFECYSNTINWNEKSNTVLMSFPHQATVVEIDRATGDLVGQYGDADGSYAFSPSTWEFGFQHFPNITPAGTLLLSSHMPGHQAVNSTPVAGEHAFLEFEIDRTGQRLVEKWVYNEGPEWPLYKGMAIRLPNGNTLGNYGTGGAIREVTPDKQTAFHVKFDVETGNDFYNKMVGHNVLIDDLYALNGGGPD